MAGERRIFSQDVAQSKSVLASPTKPAEAPAILRVMRPDAAVSLALADCKFLAAENHALPLTSRYIMVNLPGETIRPGLSLAANTALLFTSDTRRVWPLPGAAVFRLDLAEYAGQDASRLKILLDTWDRMTDDQFYIRTDKLKTVSCSRTIWQGKWYTNWNINTLIPAEHANQDGQLTELCKLTNCMVPIISAGQFMRFALNSDFGGLYPAFRQIDESPVTGTAEEAFLLRAGVNLKDLGARNADQRVILFRNPTGQPGVVEYVPAAATRASVGPTIATITRDYFAGFIQANKHPFENLADRKHDGTEIFIPTPAGGLEFGLFDGKGGFVRSAPLNPPQSLAADRTIPAPWLPVLQGPSGCIRCHLKQNAQVARFGIYQEAPNYLTWLLDVRYKNAAGDLQQFDIFADKGDATKALDRLVSLYNGETSDAFGYAGRTYAKYVLEASGLPLEEAVDAMMSIHDGWLYEFVTPSKALLMLGYQIEDDAAAVQMFNQICPPAPEPLRITQLRAWRVDRQVKITIDDWLAVYAEIALRIMKQEQLQTQVAQPLPMKEEP